MEHKQLCEPLMFQLGGLFSDIGPKQAYMGLNKTKHTHPRIVDFFCHPTACYDDDKLRFNWDIFPYFTPK